MKYKVVISEINEFEKEEVSTKYMSTKTSDVLEWHKWYNLPKEEQEDYERVEVGTGKKEIEISEKPVYEQTLEYLDIKELAIFINRVR